MPGVGEGIEALSVSEDAKGILSTGSWRPSTRKQYQCYLRKWASFTAERQVDPYQPTAGLLVDFLAQLHVNGARNSALHSASAAVATLSVEPEKLSGDRMVRRLIKSAFQLRPVLPTRCDVWDPSIVLNYLKDGKKACELTLKELTYKLVMLLALLSAQRVQTLSLLDIEDITREGDRYILRVTGLLKQTRPGYHLEPIILESFQASEYLCVVTVLSEYIARTKDLRKRTRLLISLQKPHKPVTSSTIGRWLTEVMKGAGLERCFTPHSTRKASTSKAASARIPMDTIIKAAGWSTTDTFANFYRKDIRKNFGTELIKSCDLDATAD